MKIIRLFLLLLFAVCLASCGTPRQLATQSVKESVIYEGTASNGGYIVSVIKSGSDVSSASADACRQAVYHVLFKGLVPASGTYSQKPLIADASAEQAHAEYFKEFFKTGGGYTKFVDVIPGSTLAPVRVQGGYKISAKIIVNKDALRAEMERNGIIKSLSSVF